MNKIAFENGWVPFSPALQTGQYWLWIEERVFEGDDDGRGGFTKEHVGTRHHMMLAYLDKNEIDGEFTGEIHAVQAKDVSHLCWVPVDEIRAVKPFTIIEPPPISV